ncbi:DNA/RNA non-specific endonuclease [Flavobacterium chungangensis]|uniref:DNA/RNA non-specific endonuclease n=1 Tax=Flavobacterium chungangensis TaxID=2708132 RepID=A0ABV8ZEN2_9FLAO
MLEVSKEQLQKETNQDVADTVVLPPPDEGFETISSDEAGVDLSPEIDTSVYHKIIVKTLDQLIPDITEEENQKRKENRKNMIASKTAEPVDFAYERAIGNNDSLYSNFIELIALTKRKVARIVIKENGKRTGFATGFMVSKNLMLTNWHVFQTKGMATESEAHFFYEYDNLGHPIDPVIFKMDASKFYNDKELDYCFVGIAPMDVNNQYSLEDISYLYLDKLAGKIGEVGVEKLNIIHHPLGDYKQLSIRENKFVGIDDIKIYYETDTAQGSSGSPVFNDQWQVVGLHHKSIAKMTEDGEHYLDKDGKIIPEYDGKIDITKVVWLKNEGIRISTILKHVRDKNPNDPIITAIEQLPRKEILTFSVDGKPTNDAPIKNIEKESAMETNNSKNITISVPVDALSSENSIDISLSTKKISNIVAAESKPEKGPNNELLLEVAKTNKEDGIDFSACIGYLPNFLGKNVPMPIPKSGSDTEKETALLKDRSMILKYFNYSLIFNAVKRMPLISAVNVSGDPCLRVDNSERSDDWLRDARIDKTCQLDDKFYAHSNFDKGHMSRYQDAKWNIPVSKDNELRNGVYTCFYSNSCPQVPGLNRAGGIWGKLEKAVLEKGVKKQTDEGENKMTVFNGPIFDKKTDKIFRSVRTPMDFFKIIVWLDDEGNLKATAFRLSQKLLVSNIDFDESLREDLEALDIDQVVAFKNYQCTIKSISDATEIDFQGLQQYDTFKSNNDEDNFIIDDDESIML